MRLVALSILIFFSFQIFDIPAPQHKTNLKTCCGRQICSCKHAKGAPCPFQLKKETRECHLTKVQPKKDAFASFLCAPCATHDSKAAIPNYVKDFESSALSETAPHFHREFSFSHNYFIPQLLIDLGIEHPPRSISF